MNKITCSKPAICKLILLSIIIISSNSTHAQNITVQDTVHYTISEIEQQFLQKNLVLLAAQYNVDANKALIEQAKVWDNPVLITDQNIYANNKFFEHGKNISGQPTGQFFVQIQQLIKTAGKRGKLIDLATTNTKIAELQLNDVLRNLRYTLHNDYYTLVQQLSIRTIYTNQLHQLQVLLNAMAGQLQMGNIAQKDYLRIQALVITLQQDMVELEKNISNTQTELKTLLQLDDKAFVKPTDISASDNSNMNWSINALMDTAKQHNASYQLQQMQIIYQQQNLMYQKALAAPDITVGTEFDQNSNYAPNYWGLSISLPLPLFNQNQGNIKSASLNIKQQQTIAQQTETTLKNNISNTYKKLMLTLQQNNQTQKDFYTKYQLLFNNVVQSYQQRQISLLEFLDFFDDYKDVQLRLLQQQLNAQLAKEELNYQLGINLFK